MAEVVFFPAPMDFELIFVAVSIFLNAIATIYQGFQAYQAHKSNLIQIVHEHQHRFDTLLLDAKEFRDIVEARELDLDELAKTPLYEDLVSWAERYFWLCCDEYIEAHIWKSVPKYIAKNWDEGIVGAMKTPFFRQMWQREFRSKNFRGYTAFNVFMDCCLVQGK